MWDGNPTSQSVSRPLCGFFAIFVTFVLGASSDPNVVPHHPKAALSGGKFRALVYIGKSGNFPDIALCPPDIEPLSGNFFPDLGNLIGKSFPICPSEVGERIHLYSNLCKPKWSSPIKIEKISKNLPFEGLYLGAQSSKKAESTTVRADFFGHCGFRQQVPLLSQR